MKSIIVVILALFCVVDLSAQIALLDRASELIKSKDYVKALDALSKAEQNATTTSDARTYYLKAFAYKEQYHAASKTDKEALRASALDAINKCRSLDMTMDYKKSLTELESFIAASTFNDAVELFNAKEYKPCVVEFKTYLALVSKQDNSLSDAYYYIGTSFNELKEYDSAIARLSVVRSMNYDQPLLYIDLAYLYANQKDEKNALVIIDEGTARYSKNYDVRIAQINLYAGYEKFAELEPLVESLLKDYPVNIELMLVAATTYEHNRSDATKEAYLNKAIKTYAAILAIDAANYDANYNLGVLYYNEAVDLINKNDADTDLEQLNKILEKSTQLFQQALPYLLKIYTAQKSDVKLLSSLQAIYYNLNMKPELTQISKLIADAKK